MVSNRGDYTSSFGRSEVEYDPNFVVPNRVIWLDNCLVVAQWARSLDKILSELKSD